MIDEKIEYLKHRKANISCDGKSGILLMLEDMGFSVKQGKSYNHKIFTHKSLTLLTNSRFTSFSIDCGHKPNRPMKKNYIDDVIKTLRIYKDELQELIQ